MVNEERALIKNVIKLKSGYVVCIGLDGEPSKNPYVRSQPENKIVDLAKAENVKSFPSKQVTGVIIPTHDTTLEFPKNITSINDLTEYEEYALKHRCLETILSFHDEGKTNKTDYYNYWISKENFSSDKPFNFGGKGIYIQKAKHIDMSNIINYGDLYLIGCEILKQEDFKADFSNRSYRGFYIEDDSILKNISINSNGGPVIFRRCKALENINLIASYSVAIKDTKTTATFDTIQTKTLSIENTSVKIKNYIITEYNETSKGKKRSYVEFYYNLTDKQMRVDIENLIIDGVAEAVSFRSKGTKAPIVNIKNVITKNNLILSNSSNATVLYKDKVLRKCEVPGKGNILK